MGIHSNRGKRSQLIIDSPDSSQSKLDASPRKQNDNNETSWENNLRSPLTSDDSSCSSGSYVNLQNFSNDKQKPITNNKRKLFTSLDENLDLIPLDMDYNEKMQKQGTEKFKEKFSLHCKEVKKSFMNILPKIDLCEEKCLNSTHLNQSDTLEMTKSLQTILKDIEAEICEKYKKTDKLQQSWSRNYTSLTNHSESNTNDKMENARKKNYKRSKNSQSREETIELNAEQSETLSKDNFSSTLQTIRKSLGKLNSVFRIFENHVEPNSSEVETIENEENFSSHEIPANGKLSNDSDIERLRENNCSLKMKVNLTRIDFEEGRRLEKNQEINSTQDLEKNFKDTVEIETQAEQHDKRDKFQKFKEQRLEGLINVNKFFESNNNSKMKIHSTKERKEKKISKGKKNLKHSNCPIRIVFNNNNKKKKKQQNFDVLESERKKLLKLSENSDNDGNKKLQMISYVKLEILDEKLLENLRAEKMLSTSVFVNGK